MLGKVDHVMLHSTDLEKTAEWYKKTFGFQISYLAPGAFLSMHQENMGRMDFHFASDKQNIGKGPMPYYVIEDIEKIKSWLEDKGVKVGQIHQVDESPKHCSFWDADGNEFGLEEY